MAGILNNFYLRWVAAFIAVPSLSFLLIDSLIYYDISLVVLDYAALGLLAFLLPRRLVVALFMLLTFYIVITVSSRIFYFTINSLLDSLDEVFYNNMFENAKMLGLALLVSAVMTFIFSAILPRNFKPLNIKHFTFASVVLIALMLPERFMTNPQEQFYFRLNKVAFYMLRPIEQAEYEKLFGFIENDQISDTKSSSFGIARLQDETEQNILLIVFESLGSFANSETDAIYLEDFKTPELSGKYNVSFGKIPFKGSTVAGEVRELCNKEYITTHPKGLNAIECLPNILSRRGYKSFALHGFYSKYFSRNEWYADLAFDKQVFLEDIPHDKNKRCGVNLIGVCDRDSLSRLSQEIDQAQQAKQKFFAYWMTMETHRMIDDHDSNGKVDCAKHGIRNSEVCELTKKTSRILADIAEFAAKLDNTKILIVGDHTPHFMLHSEREYYDYRHVPYIYLEPK